MTISTYVQLDEMDMTVHIESDYVSVSKLGLMYGHVHGIPLDLLEEAIAEYRKIKEREPTNG